MTATNHDNDGHRVDNDGHRQWRPQPMTATNHDNDVHRVDNGGHIVVTDIFVAVVDVAVIVMLCGRYFCGRHCRTPTTLSSGRRFRQCSHLRRSKLSLIYAIDLNTWLSTPPGVGLSVACKRLAVILWILLMGAHGPRCCRYSTTRLWKDNLTKIITNCSKNSTRAT